jgi:hypothetical protein
MNPYKAKKKYKSKDQLKIYQIFLNEIKEKID